MRYILLALASLSLLGADLKTWTLKEYFGVSYPEQTVEFSYDGPRCPQSSCRVLGPAGTEVPWQQLRSGNILVRSALAAGETLTWTLQSGTATTVAAPTSPVTVTTTTNYVQVANGLAGFRVWTATGNPAPYNKLPWAGILLGNGTWTSNSDIWTRGTYRNWGTPPTEDWSNGPFQNNPDVIAYSATVLENGPIRSVVAIEYETLRTAQWISGAVYVGTGSKVWSITLEIDAGEKYWLFSDYTDDVMITGIGFPGGFVGAIPDTAKWRGQGVNSSACGLNWEGGAYSGSYTWNTMAVGNLATMMSGCYNYALSQGCTSIWGPWGFTAGYGVDNVYYNAAAPSTAPIVGVFIGRPNKNSQKCCSIVPGANEADFWFNLTTRTRSADNSYVYPTRRSFGIYTGTKSDLTASDCPDLSAARRKASGVTLSKVGRWDLSATVTPPRGWPYTDDAAMEQERAWVRDGTAKCGSSACYYNLLYNSSAYDIRTISAMWRGNSEAAVTTALDSAKSSMYDHLNGFVNSAPGNRNPNYHYWHFAAAAQSIMQVAYAVMLDDVATEAQKETARVLVAMSTYIMDDDEFVPWREGSGDSYGTANMPVQYGNARSASFLLSDDMNDVKFDGTLAAEARAAIVPSVDLSANDYGAASDGTHYQSTFFSTGGQGLLQLKKLGLFTPTEKWRRYGNWELSALTPPEPRQSNRRSLVSEGDGQVLEVSERLGILATMWKGTDDTTAGRFIWGWSSQGSASVIPHNEFYGPSLVYIDSQITPVDPALVTQHFGGHWTNFRHGWETANELSAWFVNGDWYRDHRHSDAGQFTVYAHSAPLSTDWNPNLYYPQVAGRYMHNAVTFASEIGQAWDADNSPLGAGAKYGTASGVNAAGFGKTSYSVATFGTATPWTRACRSLFFNDSYPLIFCKDSFTGANATAAKVLTWQNVSSNNAVTTPNGSYTPTTRLNASNNGVLPSAGPVYSLSADQWHRFQFTGTTFASHATGGINWDTWVQSDAAAQYLIGHWSHNQNTVGESGQILRVNSTGGFRTLIAPFRKTEAPTRTLTQDGAVTTIVQGTETTTVTDSAATWTDGTTSILAVFDDTSASFAGASASGGPQEVTITADTITWRVGGTVGAKRTLSLPSGWYPTRAVGRDGRDWTVFHDGAQNTEQTITFTQTPVTLRRVSLLLPGIAGGTRAKVSLDGAYITHADCSGKCSVSLGLEVGSHTLRWQYLDAAGTAVSDESAAMTITVE